MPTDRSAHNGSGMSDLMNAGFQHGQHIGRVGTEVRGAAESA